MFYLVKTHDRVTTMVYMNVLCALLLASYACYYFYNTNLLLAPQGTNMQYCLVQLKLKGCMCL